MSGSRSVCKISFKRFQSPFPNVRFTANQDVHTVTQNQGFILPIKLKLEESTLHFEMYMSRATKKHITF